MQIIKGRGGLCGTLKCLYSVPKVPKIRKRDIYNKQWSTYMMVVIWFILLVFWLLMVAGFIIQEIRRKETGIYFIAIICTSVLLTVFNLIIQIQ